MIPKSTVALYKSIKAPDSLQQLVEAKLDGAAPASKKKQPWAPVLAAAACVAIVIAAALPRRADHALSAGGVSIGTAPVVVAQSAQQQRSAFALAAQEPLIISLELPENAGASIAVSHGEIQQEEDPAGMHHEVRWVIPDASGDLRATLALTIDNNTATYTLHADAFGVWYMEKEQ